MGNVFTWAKAFTLPKPFPILIVIAIFILTVPIIIVTYLVLGKAFTCATSLNAATAPKSFLTRDTISLINVSGA